MNLPALYRGDELEGAIEQWRRDRFAEIDRTLDGRARIDARVHVLTTEFQLLRRLAARKALAAKKAKR